MVSCILCRGDEKVESAGRSEAELTNDYKPAKPERNADMKAEMIEREIEALYEREEKLNDAIGILEDKDSLTDLQQERLETLNEKVEWVQEMVELMDQVLDHLNSKPE